MNAAGGTRALLPRAEAPAARRTISLLHPLRSPAGGRDKRTRRVRGRLMEMYHRLFSAWGPQHWWPGETPFEVMLGAILTQNTNWTNAAKAIANLKSAGMLDPRRLHRAPANRVARLIRSCGYYNVKARRLKSYLAFFVSSTGGNESRWRNEATGGLRAALLEVKGLGPETADSILCYALDRPVFVVDAYTRRILARHGLLKGGEDYEEVRALFEDALPRKVGLYNEFHALLVRCGKEHCHPRPRCAGCPLAGRRREGEEKR